MEINSKECNEALGKFIPSNYSEELVKELLLIPQGDDDAFANMTYKICDTLSDDEFNELPDVVTRVRKQIGLDEG
jgi:hypothetical protein